MRLDLLKHILIMTILLTGCASAINVDEVMNKANKLYRDNDFATAISEYEKLISEGFEGTSLYYNLGNAYYRIGKLGYAILYYEKALKFSPNDEDVRHNLNLASIRTVDKIDTLPKFFLFEWWETFLSFFSLSGWIVFTLIIYFLLLIVTGVYFFAGHIIHQRISFFSGTAILIILLISVSVAAVKLNRENNRIEAVIVENSAVVKLSPDEQGKDGFIIHEGLKVILDDKIDNWRKVRLPDGKVGWIQANFLRQI